MNNIKIVKNNCEDFIKLCEFLEEEHVNVIKEQRSPKGNCLNNLDKFKYVLICYKEEKPVGCIALKIIDDITGEIGRVFVLPEERHNKIATKLFDEIESIAKKERLKYLRLDTYKRFEGAVKLYKNRGYQEIKSYLDYSPYSLCMKKTL